MRLNSAVALALLATTASAQTNATSIDPNSVDAQTRASWCNGQQNGCQNLCGGIADTQTNTCQATTLAFNCTCSNGTAPDLAAYQNTMPYFICEASYGQCIDQHPNDILGQNNCTTNIRDQCGSLNSSTVASGSGGSSSSSSASPSQTSGSSDSSSSSSASQTASQTASGTQGSSSPSATKNAAMVVMANYGTGIVAAGLAGVFGLLL